MMGNPSGIELPAQQAYDQFWPKATEEIQQMEISGLKHQELPLARIMKAEKEQLHLSMEKRQRR